MNKYIRDIEHFERLVVRGKELYGAKNINCYLMPDDIESLTKNKKIQYCETCSGIWILHNAHEEYTRLYLFLNPDVLLILPELPANVVTDFVGINNKLPDKCQKVVEKLLFTGFTPKASSLRMSKTLKSDDEIEEFCPADYTVSNAHIEHTG